MVQRPARGRSDEHGMVERGSHRGLSKTELHVGKMVRRFRALRQLSVRTLADKCGFSPSFISQVERGQASPSIASTERIATALGVTLGEFFRAASPSLPAIVRVKDRPVLQSQWSNAKVETLGPSSQDSRLESLLITLKAGGASASRPYTRQTEQLAVVLRGSVTLQLDDTVQVLEEGDAVSIPAGTHHCWNNRARKQVQVLIVTARLHS